MKTLIFLSLALIACVRGQEYVPELAPHAQSHRQQSQLLQDQKKRAITTAQQLYLTALDAADKSATSAGNATALAAINKDRLAATKGGMAESFPPDLPKTLVSARKTFVRAIELAHGQIGQKQKQLDSAYLKILGTLQERAASNSKLAEQIAAEKTRVLAGLSGPLTDLTKGLEGTRWRKINPDAGGQEEWHFRGGKLNRTWPYETPAPDTVTIRWNEKRSTTAKLGKDGKTLLEKGAPVWELVISTDAE